MRYVVGVLVTLYWVAVSMGAGFVFIELAPTVNRYNSIIANVWLVMGCVVFLFWAVYAIGRAAANTVNMFVNPEYEA